jgi:hypothetical protein
MTAVSISYNRGNTTGSINDFTIGTTAPAAGDFQLSYNLTDGQGNAITMLDLHLFLEALKRAFIMSNLGLPLVANNSTPFLPEPEI